MFNSTFNSDTPLEDELSERLASMGNGLHAIQHPLVYSVPHFHQLNDHVNRSLAAKKEALRLAVANRDLSQIIALHERPFRANALMEHRGLVPTKVFLRQARRVWIDSENIYQNRTQWDLLFREIASKPSWASVFMGHKNTRQFEAIEEQVVLYRGVQTDGRRRPLGLSWSLSEDKARWFANRFVGQGSLLTMQVKKANIVAFLGDKNEEEVILHPDCAVGAKPTRSYA